MERYFKVYILTIIFCFVVDMLWLGIIAKEFYQNELSAIIRKSNGAMAPNWLGAVVVYLALIIGILFFVIPKFPQSYINTGLVGGLFGLMVYCVYDFTNYAVLQNWTLKLAIVDIVWGTFLCSLTSIFALFWYNKFT